MEQRGARDDIKIFQKPRRVQELELGRTFKPNRRSPDFTRKQARKKRVAQGLEEFSQ
jgi:hypothetical protein